MSDIANVQSTIAGLAPDETDHTINGVAIGIGDVTRGLSGERKVWQADALRAAASTLVGTKINALHSQAEVGEVTAATFDPERGILYEARLEDPDLAQQVAQGGLEVSIEARHADGGTVETERGDAMAATNIEFTGLALVQHGAAPSASASPGQAAALSPADLDERLHGTAEPEKDAEAGAYKDEDADLQEVPDEYIFQNPGQATASAEEMDVEDAEIHQHGEGDEAVFMPGASHDALLDLLREMDELAIGGEDTDDPVSPESGQGEVSAGGEPEGRTASQPDRFNQHMSETEEELRARLNEKDEQIEQLQHEKEELTEEREQVARAYAAALADGDTMLDEDDFVEKFTVAELAQKYEARDEAELVDPEPTVQSGGGEEDGSDESNVAALASHEDPEVRQLTERLSGVEGESGLADQTREFYAAELADMTGEDPENILEQYV